jgi:endonuclease/exonuclease/phosphatase family metal-dependent hydrolase
MNKWRKLRYCLIILIFIIIISSEQSKTDIIKNQELPITYEKFISKLEQENKIVETTTIKPTSTSIPVSIPETIIKVCSFNIKRGNRKIEKQRQFLLDLNPDIVGLQEVCRDKNIDNLIDLKKNTDLKYAIFNPTIGNRYGNAIISKYMVIETTVYFLYSGKLEDRLLMCNKININDKTISIYNTHLTQKSKSIRIKEFKEVKSIFDEDDTEYKILMGDFNLWDFDIFEKDYIVIFERGVDQIIVSKNFEVTNCEQFFARDTKLTDHTIVCATLKLK